MAIRWKKMIQVAQIYGSPLLTMKQYISFKPDFIAKIISLISSLPHTPFDSTQMMPPGPVSLHTPITLTLFRRCKTQKDMSLLNTKQLLCASKISSYVVLPLTHGGKK